MKKRGRPPAEVTTSPIRVEDDVAHKLRVIASIRRVTASSLASQFLRPTVDKEYAKAMKDAADNGRSTP